MTVETEAPVVPADTLGSRAPARADIQGLRAIAVLAVIANHLIGWPVGGFVGVDVFFVISGFLITGLLLRDNSEHGSLSLGRFYGRRIRRIAPAAITVLVVTVIAAHFLFNRAREWTTLWDAGYAFLFLANWHFAAVGTDYFHDGDTLSPLQHYWSLSVEEQFYLVWPGVMAIAIAVAAGVLGRRTSGRAIVGVLAAVITVASFVWALSETAANPTFAYFSTLSRVWELGIGAVLAAAVPALARLPLAARFIAGWAGLIGIVVAFAIIDDSVPFPGPGAALPVVGAALVIVGGIGGAQRYLLPLSNPVSSYLGSISYSLYLWHFPVIAFMVVLMPVQTASSNALVFALMVAIAIVSYYLIEQPFHRSPLFESFQGSGEHRRAAWQAWRDRFGSQFMGSAVGLAVVALVVVLLAGNALQGVTPQPEDESAGIETSLADDLAAAVTATTWPTNLSPSLDDAIRTTSNDNPARGCFDVGGTPNFDSCSWGSSDAPHRMFLVGDSTAMAYAPAFKKIAEGSGNQWRITTVGLYGCRFTADLVQNEDPEVMAACPQRKADIAARIAADKPDLVVVSNAFAEGKRTDGSPLNVAAMVASTVALSSSYGDDGKIVYLDPPPLGADLGQCYSPVSSPQGCTVAVDPTWTAFDAATTASAGAGNHVISSLPFNCSNGMCPAFAGTLPTKYDTVHLTVPYAEHIAPAIRNALVAAGVMQQ